MSITIKLLLIFSKLIVTIGYLAIFAILAVFLVILSPLVWTNTFQTLLAMTRWDSQALASQLGFLCTFITGWYMFLCWLEGLSQVWQFGIVRAEQPLMLPDPNYRVIGLGEFIKIDLEGGEGWRLASL